MDSTTTTGSTPLSENRELDHRPANSGTITSYFPLPLCECYTTVFPVDWVHIQRLSILKGHDRSPFYTCTGGVAWAQWLAVRSSIPASSLYGDTARTNAYGT